MTIHRLSRLSAISTSHRHSARLFHRRLPHATVGYTLVELMLVLAILGAIAAISWPALLRPWSRSLVQQAAQDLAAQLLDARLAAIEQSRVYQFRWCPGTSEYQVVPLEGDATHPLVDRERRAAQPNVPTRQDFDVELPIRVPPSSDDGSAALTTANSPRISPAELPAKHLHGRLLHEVRFELPSWQIGQVDSNLEVDQPPNDIGQRESDPSISDGPSDPLSAQPELNIGQEQYAWSGEIWFYPDGSTSNGHWKLISAEHHEIDVYLRGITGTVRVGLPRTEIVEDGTDGLDRSPRDAEASDDGVGNGIDAARSTTTSVPTSPALPLDDTRR